MYIRKNFNFHHVSYLFCLKYKILYIILLTYKHFYEMATTYYFTDQNNTYFLLNIFNASPCPHIILPRSLLSIS